MKDFEDNGSWVFIAANWQCVTNFKTQSSFSAIEERGVFRFSKDDNLLVSSGNINESYRAFSLDLKGFSTASVVARFGTSNDVGMSELVPLGPSSSGYLSSRRLSEGRGERNWQSSFSDNPEDQVVVQTKVDYISRQLSGVVTSKIGRVSDLDSLPEINTTWIPTIDTILLPTDQYFPNQWHLTATKVTEVWADYTGTGIKVGVFDNGVDYTHEDLFGNYDPNLDWDYYEGDADVFPTVQGEVHGTLMAGIIGAQNNGIGTVGVAYDVTLGSGRWSLGFPTSNLTYEEMMVARENWILGQANFDVTNNSWGMQSYYENNFTTDPDWARMESAMQQVVQTGRDGLGTVIVKASGNARLVGYDTNHDNEKNSRFVTVVAAIGEDYKYAGSSPTATWGSNPGAPVLVTAPGDNVYTTNRQEDIAVDPKYRGASGTSSATAVASGIAALILDANPNLGARDVQEILALSASQVDSTSLGWAWNGSTSWNGGGMHTSHDYGFGLIDALAAVRLAETWDKQSTFNNEVSVTGSVASPISIPDSGVAVQTLSMSPNMDIDHVEVAVDITHPNLNHLTITLTSPNGTESVLASLPPIWGTGSFQYTFSTTNTWGEDGNGLWSLSIADSVTGSVGTLNSWSVTAYGDAATIDNTYFFTDEFAQFSGAGDAARQMLDDTGGLDSINASAVTSNQIINLADGAMSTIAGNMLTLGAASVIEMAFTGDGDDQLFGNDSDNTLWGGRGIDTLFGDIGSDLLFGGAGADLLDGGVGIDSVSYANSWAGVNVDLAQGAGISGEAEGDVLVGIESLIGSDFDDVLTGSAGDNVLTGGLGDDFLSGGGGIDTAVYSGNFADYTVTSNGTLATVVDGNLTNGNEGTDTLTDIGNLWFADGVIGLDGLNNAPIAGADTVSALAGAPGGVTFFAADLLANDRDFEGSALSLTSVGSAVGGSVVLDGNGDVLFTPTANFSGQATFSYTVSDGSLSDTTTVVVDVNNGPVSGADSFTTPQGDVLSIAAATLLANDTDFDGDTLFIQSVGSAVNGTVVLDGQTQQITFIPNVNFYGAASFDYTIDDGVGGTATQTVTVNVDGTPRSVGAEFQVNTYTPSWQDYPSVEALVGGGFVATWESNAQDGSLDGIYGQVFNSSGAPVGVEFQVNTSTLDRQENMQIVKLDDGGFTVIYESFGTDGSGDGVYSQRFDAVGNKIGSEVQVNTYTSSYQLTPDVGKLVDGGYVVAWASFAQDGSSYGIYGQRFDGTGVTVGGEFLVNTYTLSNQWKPSVAGLADGGYIVTWSSNGQDGSVYGVMGQRFDAAGAMVGSEFQINTTTADQQDGSRVLVLSDGSFVVTWDSNLQDGSGYGVFGRAYDSTGVAKGAEFQLNTFTVGDQKTAEISALSDGGFVGVWQSMDQDGSSHGVYAQRFDGAGVKVGEEIQVNDSTYWVQWNADITTLNDGRLAAVWGSYNQDNPDNSAGVFAKILDVGMGTVDVAPVATGDTVTINEDTVITIAAADILLNDSDFNGDALSLTSVSNPVNGTVSLDINGDALFTPDSNFNGVARFSYTVSDGALTSTGIVTVNVVAVNDGPLEAIAISDGTEDTVMLGQLTARDIDGDALTFGLGTPATNGTVVVNADGSYSYMPDANFNGTDTFGYTVSDGTSSITATATINVAAVNDALVTTDSVAVLSGGGSGTGWFTASDVEDVYSAMTFAVETGPAHGSVIINADNSYTYTPTAGFAGADVFTFRATDSGGASTVSSVGVTATSVQGEGGAEVQVNTLLSAGIKSPDIATLADGGYIVTYSTYTLDGSAYGIAGQRYDAGGAVVGGEFLINTYSSSSQNYSSVAALNNGGFVVSWMSFGQDGDRYGIYGQRFDAAGVAAGVEFQASTWSAGDQSYPSVTTMANGDFVIAWGSANFDGSNHGVAAQRYTEAGVPVGGETQLNTYISNVQANTALTAMADGGFVAVWRSYGQDGSNYGIAGQRYDAAGVASGVEFLVNTYTTDVQQYPEVASLADGGFMVVWESNGQDGSSYGVYGQRYDATGAAAGVEFLVNTSTAGAQNNPSVTGLTNGDFIVTWDSNGTDGSSLGVFGQRYDATGVQIGAEFLINTYTVGDQSKNAITALPGGEFVVTWHSLGQDGSSGYGLYAKTFSVANVAQTGFTATGSAGNDLLNGRDGSDTLIGGAGDDALNGGLGFDTAVYDGNVADYSISGTSVNATVIDNNVSNGDEGVDTLTGVETLTFADHTVYLDGTNNAPIMTGETATATEDDPSMTFLATDLLANDFDVDGDIITLTSVGNAVGGTVTQDVNGDPVFTPAANFNGVASFTYSVSDGLSTSTATVTVNVAAVNDAPIATAGNSTGNEDTVQSGQLTATDVEGDALTFTLATQAANGAVVVNADGTYTYTPAANYNGADSFSYTVSDGLLTSTATVTLGVTAVNDAPIATAGNSTGNEDTVQSGQLTATDVEGDALTFTLATQAANGAVVVNADGTYTYTPAANYNGADSFSYTVSDGLLTSTATVTLGVTAVNDAPIATAGNSTGNEDTVQSGQLTATDVEGDALTFTLTTQAANGAVVVNADGTYTYTPAANYNGADSFSYTVSDGLLTSTATVTVNVAAVNDAPISEATQVVVPGGSSASGWLTASDVDGDALTYTLETGSANGGVVVNADGSYTYTTTAGFAGTDTFTFRATDASGAFTINSANVLVTSVTGEAGAEFQVNTFTNSYQLGADIATFSDGSYTVFFHSQGQDGHQYGVFGQRYDAVGTAMGTEFQVNTYTTGHQWRSSVTVLPDDSFVVVWQSEAQDGSSSGIFGQRFDSAGTALGAEFQVNTITASVQALPTVEALANGDFIVAWRSFGVDGSDYTVRAQRYTAAGTASGVEYQVNTVTYSLQADPRIAAMSDGGYVMTWKSFTQDGSGYAVIGQRYDAAGVALAAEFVVNTYTSGNQIDPEISALSGGGFVVVWQSAVQDGDLDGIFGQRYDALGVAAGGEFQVNTTTAGAQTRPSLAALANGDFIVTWDSNLQDGSDLGVYAQRFSASGAPIGTEIQVNTYTTAQQGFSTVEALPDGGFVVAWRSWAQDGNGYGVFAKKFSAANVAESGFSAVGGAGNDVLIGREGNDILQGLAGNDILTGGAGADTYVFGRGDDIDTINNLGEGGGGDSISFDLGVAKGQLWFSQVGNDLTINVIGTGDQANISDWYLNAGANQVDMLVTSDGWQLGAGNVQVLVDAMATMTPPPLAQINLTTAEHTQLDPVIAVSWQVSGA